jgi:hypothetical protein
VKDELNKIYPTTPDAEGLYYANEADEAMAITTKDYDNGNRIKRIPLSTGKVAIVRELMGHEVLKYQRIADGDREMVLPAMIAVSTKIDGQEMIVEDYLHKVKAKDYTKIMLACQDLNF